MFWFTVCDIEYAYGETFRTIKTFSSKKWAEDYILSALDREHFKNQEKKDRKEFKKLNPPYDFP